MEPFRCGDISDRHITVDFNHPLADLPLTVTASVHSVLGSGMEKGGGCMELGEALGTGPGMQVRWRGRPTDFFSASPFERTDDTSDRIFYEKPRLVSHLDAKAREIISGIYDRHLQPGMRVLDLMSSWQSHISKNPDLARVTGLGMNSEELEANPRLTDFLVRDLNLEPTLPFDDQSFDAVICTASVEYLTQPFKVFEDVRRVLSPGGLFMITFSNRWFPPKSIRIWNDIHEFERMGLVLEYFHKDGGFRDLGTESVRGFPRPEDDKYYGEYFFADPVYCVYGKKA